MGVDMLFILLLALILFGPKRLPEIARQVGKFVAEFKRASNDFKYQLQVEIDKAGAPASSHQAQQSSPSTPTLLPPAETSPAQSTATPQHADSGHAGDAESEHERLMRTARMAYQAQAFTLRPPEPPPVSHAAQPVPAGSSSNPPMPEQARTEAPAEPVAVPSAPSAATDGDSPAQRS